MLQVSWGVFVGLGRTLLGLIVVVSRTNIRLGYNLVLLLLCRMLDNLLHLKVGYELVALC